MSKITKDHWLFRKPIAHRGLHTDKFPENSIPAFVNAVEQGYPIEMDIRISMDGELFVMHDDDAKRLTGEKLKATEQTMAHLRTLRLCGTVYRIPTFDEVLNAVAGRVPLIIEVKQHGSPGLLEKKLTERLKKYKDDCESAGEKYEVAVKSFDPRVIRTMKKLDSTCLTGQLSQNMKKKKIPKWQKWILEGVRHAFYSKPDFISYRFNDLPHPKITAMRQQGVPVIGWTVRAERDIKKALKNCDNYIFENINP